VALKPGADLVSGRIGAAMGVDYEALLDLLRRDMAGAEPQYQPTHYWRQCARRLETDLAREGLERFRASPGPLTHFVPTYTFGALAGDRARLESITAGLHDALPLQDKLHRALDQFLDGQGQAEADYRVYRASCQERRPFVGAISESTVGAPVGQFEFSGRRYSRSMLNYLLGLNFAKTHIEDLCVNTVLEIGGGFGSLGEVLLGDDRNGTFYVDVDIPPTAVYATYYLGQVLGSSRVIDYARVREQEELDLGSLRRDGDAAVLPPWLLPRLTGHVDLFVNFISFQEMEPDVVQGYLGHVARLQARHVLLRNLAEGKEIAHTEEQLGVREPIRSEDYDRFLPDYDLVATNVFPFGYRTVDGYHSELRLYRRRSA